MLFFQISKEVLYGNHSPLHSQALQGSMSPPVVRSMPSSPSRRTIGGRSTGGRRGTLQSGSSTLPREGFSRGGQASASCSSVILERRDVMPGKTCTSLHLHFPFFMGPNGPRSFYHFFKKNTLLSHFLLEIFVYNHKFKPILTHFVYLCIRSGAH